MTKHRSSPAALPLQASGGVASVLSLELRSLNAWPAPQTLLLDGWALRLAGGYTKRANSVNAIQAGAKLDAALLREIEQIYAQQGQPCIFRLSPLADSDADALLEERGYKLQDPSLFWHRTSRADDLQWQSVDVQPQLSDAWLDGLCAACAIQEGQRLHHRAILQSIELPCAYGSVMRNGRALAWGLAVLQSGAMGLYDVVVDPAMRGQGLGRALMQGLLKWGAEQGAVSADLQVTGSNTVAQSLYASLGFEWAYGYHYRIAAPSRD